MLVSDFTPVWRGLGMLMASLLSLCANAQRIEALPQAASSASAPLDLGALAERFARSQFKPDSTPRLRILISLSMPQATLVRLGEQAQRSGGVLVLRGLVEGSLTRTVARLHEVFGAQLPTMQIDPQSFERFAVHQVPSFIVTLGELPKTCTDDKACAQLPAPPFVNVAGDVSLDYALTRMASHSSALAPTARALLNTLNSRPEASRRAP